MNFMFIKFRFILVDIGDSGRHSDGGVLSNSDFGQALVNGSLRYHATETSLCDCCRRSISLKDEHGATISWKGTPWSIKHHLFKYAFYLLVISLMQKIKPYLITD